MNATMQAPGMTNFQLPPGGYMMPPQFGEMPMQPPQPATMAPPADMRRWNPMAPGRGPGASPANDLARLRQERALQYYQRAFGMPHAERQNTPALSQEQIAAMIGRIRQARGM